MAGGKAPGRKHDCDRILIIDGGTVADYDTHENLMKKPDSLYYKLFHSQAENYKLEEI